MPGGKRKKFIDKKNAVTFQLVHRSQKDPLQADETAPKHVLLEKRTGRPFQGDDRPGHVPTSDEKRKEEQRKYGIYFDDDYNYLQHLKDVNVVADWEPVVHRVRIPAAQSSGEAKAKKEIRLPSSVFQSTVEEKEGLLNKAAPQVGPRPDWDPDVVAALDDDFDFEDEENVLEDDFIQLADGVVDPADVEDEEETDSCDDEDEDFDSAEGSEEQFSFTEEETRSRFTNYSMSSSVIRRSEGLKTLDERFEEMFKQYDDLELGALDGEEIEGYVQPDSEIMKSLVAEFQHMKQLPTLKEVTLDKGNARNAATMAAIEEEGDELVDMQVDTEAPQERWDCESILSTYSNLYNHPKLITEPKKEKIKLSARTGLPVKEKGGLSRQGLKQLDREFEGDSEEETRSRTSVASSIRPKDETPEQRRVRKAAVRAMRRERRAEKKANTEAFKTEKLRQEKAMANVQQNLTTMRLY
uniref:Protein LTV1 homolog n=1 Tax=Amblyomma americanum TaxID=6943 RepID=A0A0C9SCJ3_AMBAM